MVKLISQLRQSVGTFSVDWAKPALRDRPCLSLLRYEPDVNSKASLDSRLICHPILACQFAFTVPLRQIRCGFEADDDWQFSECPSYRDPRIADGSTAGYFEDIYQDSELGAGQPSALNYRTQSVNVDGLTCLDVLMMASDV